MILIGKDTTMDENLYVWSDGLNFDIFESIVLLHNCRISLIDDDYYVVEGSSEDLDSFCQDLDAAYF